MAVKRTKVVVKVELPAGKLGLTAVGSPPAVGAVRTDSPVVGQVAPGDIILSLTRPGLGDVDTTNLDGQAVMETLVAFAEREGRSLTVEKHGMYRVGVPPGPLGVSFVDGTCTVHAVKPTSPLGATVEGNTLLSVNGQPVTPTTILDVIKAADDGTSECKLVFLGTGCEIVEGIVVAEGPALTNETLRDWVGRWCGGELRKLKGYLRRFDPHLPQLGNREGIPPISKWNTSRVTDMSRLFMGKSKFNDDISAWDTSNVTDMSYMFHGAKSFNQPLNDWCVDNVTNMRGMFSCVRYKDDGYGGYYVRVIRGSSFNQPLNDWRVDNVTTMHYMFHGASAFNQPLGNWRVDKVTNMQSMFHSASSFNQALNGWRVDNVTDMCAMFYAASAFNQPLNDWRVDNVTNMSCMFLNASSFNQPLGDWRVDNVTMMSCMFMGATSFNQPLDDWRLVVCCLTERMFYGTNFENSRPVRRACCAVSWREHLRIAWSFAKIIFVDGR